MATIIIDEYDSASQNDLFDAAQTYLSSRCLSSASAPSLRFSKRRNSPHLTSSLPPNHSLLDLSFRGIPLRWSFVTVERPSASEHRSFKLSFHSSHREAVYKNYLPHVLEEAARIRFRGRERHLYTNRSLTPGLSDDHHLWASTPFSHPSTFDTLAIDPALRDEIRADLLCFSASRDYYARVGRSWKRGYLLHGPPGTGKTSLIAAMANFLEFDVYDLELTVVSSNSHLRKLLVSTTSKSVIVVEDVDCSLHLSDRNKKPRTIPDIESAPRAAGGGSAVSLSGVLNFVDGLWSSCVGERLMIFTTNHPERLDPALLRPGRMDKRIHLGYCGPAAFRVLARNYMEVEEQHNLMAEAEEMLGEVSMTPADIAEVFMGCDGDGADVGMRRVVEEMQRRQAMLLPRAGASLHAMD